MRHALSLGRMVTLIEKEKNAISQPMLGYMK